MAYKSFTEQVSEHIHFLRKEGFEIEELKINEGFIRCHKIGNIKGRGELSYKATSHLMNNGLIGIATWCRNQEGSQSSYQTYGLNREDGELLPTMRKPVDRSNATDDEKYLDAAKKAYGFWQHSAVQGTSDYLMRKDVGSYGIRFRENNYGRVAIVPLFDFEGRLWNYQLLNPDGTKRFAKNARTEGLFHCLTSLTDGKPFGVAESYATAATCYELTGIPMVCAFSCHNLPKVAEILRPLFSASPMIVFADNDRHLHENQGVLKANEAILKVPEKGLLAIPDFGDIPASKVATDWNDLVRLKGKDVACCQLQQLGLKLLVE